MAAAIAGLALPVAILVAIDAAAQQAPPFVSDEMAQKMLQLGLKNIERAVCDGFNTCAPATPQELQYPPITLEQARAAVMVGTRTALASWCGFDGDQRSALPMMQQLRQKARLNNRQLALIAVIHGIQSSIVSEQLKARGDCDATTRRNLDAQLPKG
jgi:hypothetical protein